MPIRKKSSGKTAAIKIDHGQVVESEPSEEPKQEHRAPVTQVVEVVDDSNDKDVASEKEVLETIKHDAEEIAESVSALESTQDVIQEPDAQNEPIPERDISENPTQDQKKEMVDELFATSDSSVMPEISMHTRNTTKTMIIWGTIVIGVAVLTGGVLLTILGKGGEKFRVSFGPSPTPTTAETPTPTPTPDLSTLKRSDLTVEVLNGGGVAGAGSKMKKLLEDKGYSVTKVGNTEEYTYDKTQILVKSAKASFLDFLNADLKDSYTVDKAESTLPPEASADSQIIVGKE